MSSFCRPFFVIYFVALGLGVLFCFVVSGLDVTGCLSTQNTLGKVLLKLTRFFFAPLVGKENVWPRSMSR